MKIYSDIVKPSIDRILGLLLLLITLPIQLICALIALLSTGRALFTQKRIGLNDRPFILYKWTSMRNGNVTHGGSFLRRSGLDELPQLWNVVRGDMSFVGPRPLLPEYLDIYSEVHKRRHTVKPGITGLAQVSGRNALKWKDKLDLDVLYAENQTFALDSKILVQTGISIFKANRLESSPSEALSKDYLD